MRLEELTRVDLSDLPSDRYFIDDILSKHGFTNCGEGLNGTVFENPRFDYLLKIFSKNDQGYLTFLRYCLANRGNPHLPVFRGKFKQVSEHYYACRMERLQPIPMMLADKLGATKLKIKARLSYHKPITVEYLNELFGDAVPDSFIQTLIGIIENAHDSGGYDLHGGNVMKRGSTLVIIDPYT